MSCDPQRIISLVPSITESLFDLGFGDTVIGITDYCIHPGGLRDRIASVGGPKNANIEKIITLNPDLVLANQEENTPEIVWQLQKASINVRVSFPLTIRQALDDLWDLTRLFSNAELAVERLLVIEKTLDWVLSIDNGPNKVSYFCPIWQGQTSTGIPWWMTFNETTYPSNLLNILGFENVFATRRRCYPLEADLGLCPPEDIGERDTRYPHITQEEIQAAAPDMLLLPNEPFEYTQKHRLEFERLFPDIPAVRSGRIHLLDGSLITWYGTRLARALVELPLLLSR